jgi:hypothetical protein
VREAARDNGHDVAELTVRHSIPDIARFVTRVERMRDGELIERVVGPDRTCSNPQGTSTEQSVKRSVDLSATSSRDLLSLYSRVLRELLSRRVIRTLNAPAGDLAETLVANAYEGELAPNSEKSWDVRGPDGRQMQVKARVVAASAATKPIQFSVFRSWGFDAAVFVVLAAETYDVLAAVELPAQSVEAKANQTAWVGGARLTVSIPVLKGLPGAIDRTALLQQALERLDEPVRA